MSTLTTTESVIDALGGVHAVAALTRARTFTVVHNWRRRRFPATTCLVMNEALHALGLTADRALWRQIPTTKVRGHY